VVDPVGRTVPGGYHPDSIKGRKDADSCCDNHWQIRAGKTTLMEVLIPELSRRGYRIATVKHHSHSGFEVDQPGKDSWRHARAGSVHVIIAAPDKNRLLSED